MVTPLAAYTQNNTRREDLSDLVGVLAELHTPLFARFGNQGMAATSASHEWVNTKLQGYKDQLNGGINSSVTSITVDGSFQGLSNLYQDGTVIRIDDELIRVSDASSSPTLTVVRGIGSTTAAAHNDNARVEIVSTPRLEGFTPSTDRSQFGSKDSNVTQIFIDAISLTGSLQSQTYVGNENNMSTQLERVQKQLLKELERSIIMGRKITGTSSVQALMGGFENYIPTSNVNSDGGPLTAKKIDDSVLFLLRNGATPDLLIVSNAQKGALNDLKVSRVEGAQAQGDRSINNLVDIYHSEAGPLEILRSNDVPEDTVYLVQSDRIMVVPMQGRRFGVEPLSKTGDFDQAMVVGEYTMQFRNPEAHYKITDLST